MKRHDSVTVTATDVLFNKTTIRATVCSAYSIGEEYKKKGLNEKANEVEDALNRLLRMWSDIDYEAHYYRMDKRMGDGMTTGRMMKDRETYIREGMEMVRSILQKVIDSAIVFLNDLNRNDESIALRLTISRNIGRLVNVHNVWSEAIQKRNFMSYLNKDKYN